MDLSAPLASAGPSACVAACATVPGTAVNTMTDAHVMATKRAHSPKFLFKDHLSARSRITRASQPTQQSNIFGAHRSRQGVVKYFSLNHAHRNASDSPLTVPTRTSSGPGSHREPEGHLVGLSGHEAHKIAAHVDEPQDDEVLIPIHVGDSVIAVGRTPHEGLGDAAAGDRDCTAELWVVHRDETVPGRHLGFEQSAQRLVQ